MLVKDMQNIVSIQNLDKPKKKKKNNPKKKKEKSAKKKERQAKKSKRRGVAYGQKKEAEKLAQGMIHRNTALQLLGCEVKEEELVTNKDAVEETERAHLAALDAYDYENDQCASGYPYPSEHFFSFPNMRFPYECALGYPSRSPSPQTLEAYERERLVRQKEMAAKVAEEVAGMVALNREMARWNETAMAAIAIAARARRARAIFQKVMRK